MGWPHEIARLWLNAGAAWIAVGSSSAAPEWISVPEGQQTRRVWRTTAQETWPELLYWSGLLALAAAGACVFWSLSLDQVAVGTQTQRRRGRTAGPPTTLSAEPRSSFRGFWPPARAKRVKDGPESTPSISRPGGHQKQRRAKEIHDPDPVVITCSTTEARGVPPQEAVGVGTSDQLELFRVVQACCGSHVLTMAASLELFGLLALGGAIFSTRAILSSRSRVLLPGLPQLRRSFSAVFSIIFETVELRRFVSALVQRRFDGSTARSWLPTSTGALASSRFRR